MIAAKNYLPAIFAAFLLVPTLRTQDTAPLPKASQQTQQPAPIVRPRPITLPPKSSGASTSPTTPASATATLTKRVQTPAASSPASSATSTTSTTSTTSSQSMTPKPAPVHHASTALFSSSTTTGPLIPAPPGPFNRATVFIDAAHGGPDSGGRINDSVTEKDVDLQLAFKLRSLLAARGFTVVLSREDDTATIPDKPDTPLTLDARAGMANHARPAACLLLHATGSGRGVHLYSSELTETSGELSAAPWLTAQVPWVTQSLRLEKQIGNAIIRAGIALVLSRASVRPVDSLTCPALVIELAPNSSDSGSINDNAYQQRVAQAISTALIFWQNAAQPPPRLIAMPSAPAPASASSPVATTPGAQP